MKNMPNSLTIREITEAEADRWLKYLYGSGGELRENLNKAFHGEKGNPPKALPAERIYYMAYAGGSEELLAGINAENFDISSLAKVVPKDKSKARGRDCVKKLIEEIIIIKCRNAHKNYFCVRTNNEGKGVFEYLGANLPSGIREIVYNEYSDGYFSFTLHLDGKG